MWIGSQEPLEDLLRLRPEGDFALTGVLVVLGLEPARGIRPDRFAAVYRAGGHGNDLAGSHAGKPHQRHQGGDLAAHMGKASRFWWSAIEREARRTQCGQKPSRAPPRLVQGVMGKML
jgi:hypothetical protein